MSDIGRPSPEALAAAERLLREKETSVTRDTLMAHGAYLEKWLEGQGLSPGEHAETVALRTVLADREARLAEAEAKLSAYSWTPLGDRHKDGRWLVVMHENSPKEYAIARWLDTSPEFPWRVRGAVLSVQKNAVTHCAEIPCWPEMAPGEVDALALSYPKRVFHSADDGGFIAVAPDLPGSSAFGHTEAEAIAELNVAIPAWISACRRAGNPVPAPSRGDAR